MGLKIQNNEAKVDYMISKNKKVNWNTFLSKLTLTNWRNVINEINVDSCANNFHNILTNCINDSTLHTLSCAKKHKIKPWITSGLLISISNKDKLSLKAKKSHLTLT